MPCQIGEKKYDLQYQGESCRFPKVPCGDPEKEIRDGERYHSPF